MRLFNNIVFYIFLLVIMLKVSVTFNLFDNALSVVLPLVFIVVYFFFIIFLPKRKFDFESVSQGVLISFLILSNFILIPVLQILLFDNLVDGLGRSSNSYMFVISSLCISWFLIGIVLSHIREISSLSIYGILFSLAFSVYLMSTSFIGNPFVDYYYLSSLRSDDLKVHHLLLTEPLTFIIFLSLSIFYNTKIKWLFLFLFLFLFLSLGGRTAFFCAILTILIYEFVISGTLSFFSKILFSASIIIIFFTIFNISDNMFFDKIFFKGGLDSDESAQARIDLLLDFSEGFFQQFVIGYPNFLIEKNNDLGSYSHNILSIFQFYGFTLFAVTIYAIYYITKMIFRYKIYHRKNALDVFGVLMFVYATLSLLTGKALLFGPFWFVLGFLLFRIKILIKEDNYV